jgi:hypothetical protein
VLFGHNTNVSVGGITFHVQTEDRGIANALIDTTVHCRGRVMHRRTNNYFDLLPLDSAREHALRQRIDHQHHAVLEEMRSGKLHLPPPPPEPPPRQAVGAALAEPPAVTHSTPPLAQPAPPLHPSGPRPASRPLAAPAPTHLKLELLNKKDWLRGNKASLQILVRDATSHTISGANISVRVDAASGPVEFLASSDAEGRASLDFEMPRLSSGGIALHILGTYGSARGQLRFGLRARRKAPAP